MENHIRTHWVMDFETLSNCFIGVFEAVNSEKTRTFVIHESKNDLQEFLTFLKVNIAFDEWHVSYNGISFDSQITEHILKNANYLSLMKGQDVAKWIYGKAQDTIEKSRNNEYSDFPEWKLSIQQIDVFKINHWDNQAKKSSLKWIQFSMDYPTIQDMPISHTECVTSDQIPMIIDYCINDVKSTKKILHLSKPLLNVRTTIKNKYGLNCYNYSNTKLGSELLLKLYCDATGKNPFEVKKYRTYRDSIDIGKILFPYFKFQSAPFISFFEMLKTKIIYNTKNDFEYTAQFKGFTFYYGSGGIHQCIKSGVYKADDEFIIKDLDVASLYPSIACVNEMYPEHLGKEFFKVYKNDLVDVRLAEKVKPKADKDMAIIEGFKEASNAAFGNSNSEYSWLFDSSYAMETTINGQLLITMLVEDLLINIPEAKLLQTNTDGATLYFSKKYVNIYESICKNWEKITKLTLEFADYKAMYVWDINNYISIYTDGNYKCKGRFEWEDLANHKYTHLHKNKSFLIIPKAIFNYFVNDIDPETFLKENQNIFDYCGGVKIKGDWAFEEHFVVKNEYKINKLQNTIRYFISNSGSKIIKVNKSTKKTIQVEASRWMQTVYINHKEKEFSEYNINYDFYLKKIKQEIQNIEPIINQFKLFDNA